MVPGDPWRFFRRDKALERSRKALQVGAAEGGAALCAHGAPRASCNRPMRHNRPLHTLQDSGAHATREAGRVEEVVAQVDSRLAGLRSQVGETARNRCHNRQLPRNGQPLSPRRPRRWRLGYAAVTGRCVCRASNRVFEPKLVHLKFT